MRLGFAIAVGLVVAGLASAGASAQSKPPYEIVRSLEALHDQMALGNKASQTAMPSVLRQLGSRLVAEDPSVWRDPRNTRAVVVYILSGGEIRVARAVLRSGKCPAAEKALVTGALAYLEGDTDQAETLLGPIDARSLDPALGGHIALAQAALVAGKSPTKAMALLDIARILAPGTLVEDAALRREVFLAEEAGDFDKFVSLSDQYFRRFGQSVYAESFHHSFAVSLARLSQSGESQQLASLSELLSGLSARDQLRIYLQVAQYSLLNGKVSVAKWASTQAAYLAQKEPAELHHAELLDGAASVLSTDYDRGLEELKGLEDDHLSYDDAMLRDAALGIATQIRQWPKNPAAKDSNAAKDTTAPIEGPLDLTPPKNAATDLPGPLGDTVSSNDSAMDEAQRLLNDSDALLEGQAP
jgi:chemotaxis protein MotC